jgi:hypothetical protein
MTCDILRDIKRCLTGQVRMSMVYAFFSDAAAEHGDEYVST